METDSSNTFSFEDNLESLVSIDIGSKLSVQGSHVQSISFDNCSFIEDPNKLMLGLPHEMAICLNTFFSKFPF